MTRAAFKVTAALAFLFLAVPAGVLRAELPSPGTDVMRAAGSIELTVPGVGTDYVRLFGQVAVQRALGGPDTIPIEIVSLQVTGFSPVFGRVELAQDPGNRSLGRVVMSLPVETPADSFFDVFFDVSLPDLGARLAPTGSFNIQARTTAIPFFDVFTEIYSQRVLLMDGLTGQQGILTHVALDPRPQVDILATEARLSWTLERGSETVLMSGRSLVVVSDAFDPGTGHPEINTEILAMDLTGNSALVGPIQFSEQAQVHSPGRAVAISPGPPVFPADSFFDVFFDISTSFFDVFVCLEPLPERAQVSAWPPLGTPYLPPGPCKLFDRNTGGQVGTLDDFSWVWTQPAGTCVDADGDGVFAPPCGNDCDDNDPSNYPGNLESCTDGRDNNCNQLIDCGDPLCLGRACDDGNSCTKPDVCVVSGVCAGQPVDCDDKNPCTIDRCNPVTGQCEHLPVVCDDGNQCTRDSCDPATGQCRFEPLQGALCDDGNACTEADRCVFDALGNISCQGAPVNCDDNDPCTLDRCDPQASACVVPDNGGGTATLPPQGCGYVSQSDLMIINGLPAGTTIDLGAVQRNFSCPMAPLVCSFVPPVPGVDCDQPGGTLGGEQECADSTLALRLVGTGTLAGFNRAIDLAVSFETHAGPRTAGDPVQSFPTDMFRLFGQLPLGDPDFDLLRLTAGTDFGMPSPGHTTLTQQGGNWAVDSFFDITYRIDFVGAPGGTLAGMSGSTTGTVRFSTGGGPCVHIPVNCDDGNPCTVDRCNPVTGQCEHLPVVCDDGNQCTKDSCDPATGACKFEPMPGAPCDDGNACTGGDRCVFDAAGGISCQGDPINCDDNDKCTLDRCNPDTGECEHLPVVCDDQNRCTQDSCDPATGQCLFVPLPDGTLCDDGNACTRPDVCRDGQCAGPPVSCDDQDPCTLDRCNPLTGLCEHAPVSCDDNNICTQDACNPVTGACEHRPIPVIEPDPILFRDQVTISWAATPDATHWNTYRGTIPATMLGSRLPGSVYDQVCYESDDAGGDGANVSIDLANPSLGTASYYLTSGEGLCGESSIGHPSSGPEIPNTSPCPTPP